MELALAALLGQMALRQISQYFGLLGRDAADFFGKLLNLADEVLFPHEVLVGVRGR